MYLCSTIKNKTNKNNYSYGQEFFYGIKTVKELVELLKTFPEDAQMLLTVTEETDHSSETFSSSESDGFNVSYNEKFNRLELHGWTDPESEWDEDWDD